MKDFSKVYNKICSDLENYCKDNNIKALILGISGGIDSTVCAIICQKVAQKLGIKFIGRSLPIKNKRDEFDTSKLIGEAFCDDFKIIGLGGLYGHFLDTIGFEINDEISIHDNIVDSEKNIEFFQTKIANGNIQARLRMTYLYNLASINKGMVIDTDNLTENYLGFFTVHGDVGDYKPIGGLWKTEVYGLANFLYNKLKNFNSVIPSKIENKRLEALKSSIEITPTDGLGISSSDFEQIGAKSYEEVDSILQGEVLSNNFTSDKLRLLNVEMHSEHVDVVEKVLTRYKNSQFKRNVTFKTEF